MRARYTGLGNHAPDRQSDRSVKGGSNVTNRFKMMRALFSGGAAMPALALLGAGIGMVALSAPAAAQDYTSGAVTGAVTADSGPVAGAQVTVRSRAQGQTRTFTTSNSGGFTASGLAPGIYDVTVQAPGFRDYTDTFSVVAAQENRITLTLLSTSAPANDIVVTGSRIRQDFTKTQQGLNIDVPALTSDVPIARSVTALVLLAPTTNPGATGFGNVPSIGGSSVAENAYYINGLNITNPDTYVGSTRVPFDFYQNVDVQTAGYAAEFGRATGGVINATTKSGSNTPFMALHGNFAPFFAQANGGLTGAPSSPTNLPKFTASESEQFTIEAGGALIKDHLFVYGLFEPQVNNSNFAVPSSGYYEKDKSTTPFYGGKVDAYLTSTQHLEFTFFDTTAKTYVDRFKFTTNAAVTDGTIGAPIGSEVSKTGGFNFVARYTGNITDFFQISGAYGINKDSADVAPADTSSYFVQDLRNATVNGIATTISQQKFSGNATDDTKRKFYRVDGDLRFALVGQHHVRFGIDNEDLSETKITQLVGGLPILYQYYNNYARLTYERLGGAISGNDRAYYLQDSWEPAQGLTINAGVRDDTFKQYNLENQKYLDLQNNWAARAGFNYVPNGDSKFRFAGSYGRYFIPPAMNLGFRGHDDYFRAYYRYPTGYTAGTFPTDPTTGLPLLALGTPYAVGGGKSCPTNISSAPGAPTTGTNNCVIYGNNTQDPAFAKVAPGTKPTSEDEFAGSIGFQATPLLRFKLDGVYRRLNNVSEDSDLYYYLEVANGCFNATIPAANAASCAREGNGNTYYIWNPHSGSQVVRDWVTGNLVTLTNLQFPKPKRTYKAVTLTVDRADDGKWLFHGSVTASRSYGNYEGTVKSDAGNGAQVDAGATQDFDYIGLTDNSTGILPNDHALVFKSYAFYHVNSALSLGYNLIVQSPMHGSCEGIYPETNVQDDGNSQYYNASSFYCGTNLVNGVYTTQAASPRGTAYKTDWNSQLDLSLRFKVPGTDLVLRADVFNVLNKQAVIQYYNQHETIASYYPGGTTTPDPLYRTPLVYQTPRYARFGFDWKF